MTRSMDGTRVLVTGAGGFIGSHLVEELARRGAQVRAFVRYKSRGMRGWLDEMPPELHERVEVFPGDVTDPGSVCRAAEGCEVLYHLAALIGIPYSYRAPISYVQTNVTGTLNMLEAARETGARLVTTSTSEVYGTARTAPITEDHPLQAQSPYAATKIAADKIAESYARSFGTPVVIARPFNSYGPRQSARAVVPTIISQLYAGVKAIQLGSLHPTRDLNYVSDTVNGIIACASAPDSANGTVFNLGSGTEISIGDLAKRIMKVIAIEANLQSTEARQRPAQSEVERLVADASRAKELLGWEAKVSLDEGIERTADWIAAHPDEYRVEEYTV